MYYLYLLGALTFSLILIKVLEIIGSNSKKEKNLKNSPAKANRIYSKILFLMMIMVIIIVVHFSADILTIIKSQTR